MTFIFRNWTTFWDIPKWNRGQTKWDGGSIYFSATINAIEIRLKLLGLRVRNTLPKRMFCVSSVFFFFLSRNIWLFLWTVHGVQCSWTHKFHFSVIFSLKMGPTVLFTHLKIILLHYFSVFSFSFQFLAVSKRTLYRPRRKTKTPGHYFFNTFFFFFLIFATCHHYLPPLYSQVFFFCFWDKIILQV